MMTVKSFIYGTDILYMYEEEDSGFSIPAEHYYGELDYTYYKGESENPVKWLYLGSENLKDAAESNGFKVELVLEEGDSYLADLFKCKNKHSASNDYCNLVEGLKKTNFLI